ncbi:MAG: ATP-binding domain-containing protein [Ruminococcus sp.]|nr:ATP-binding domain-containing protein [Ruminococcus sp.]
MLNRFVVSDTSAEDYVPDEDAVEYWTIHRFKGLEKEIVFYLDYPTYDESQRRVLTYTALSRAKFALTYIKFED